MTYSPFFPPRYINVPSIVAFNKRIPSEIKDTWVWLRGLCWDTAAEKMTQQSPLLSTQKIADIIGRTRQSAYGHMLFLRDSGLLRWTAQKEGIYVSFPEDGELFMDAPNVSKIFDTGSSLNPLNINQGDSIGGIKEGEGVKNFLQVEKLARAKPGTNTPTETVPREALAPIINALAFVTEMDKNLNYGRLAKEAKALYQAGYTADQITFVYGPNGPWWLYDWRGRDKHEPPNIGVIRSTIKALLVADTSRKVPAAPPPSETPLARELRLRQERINNGNGK